MGTKRSKIKTVKNTESSAQKRKIMNMKNEKTEWMNDDDLY